MGTQIATGIDVVSFLKEQHTQIKAMFANVNAAGFVAGPLAPESIVAAFGSGFSAATEFGDASATTLAGVTVRIRDSAGVERLAPLYAVSPTQVNYVMPAGTAETTSSQASRPSWVEAAPRRKPARASVTRSLAK